jgi:hypothetical protein
MQGHRNTLCFHVPGTLAADLSIVWTAAFDGRIMEVSSVGSNANDGLLKVGTTSDDDYYLASHAIGDSSVPVTKTRADFASTADNGKFSKDDVLAIALDYDGAGGTATDDFTLVITILEG